MVSGGRAASDTRLNSRGQAESHPRGRERRARSARSRAATVVPCSTCPPPSLPGGPGDGRRATHRAALAALALLVALLGPAGSASASAAAGHSRPTRKTGPARAAEQDPLLVHLDSISPVHAERQRRPITITGTVTNQSDELWTDINLYAFRSAAPIVDATSLADSAGVEADAYVGERIVDARHRGHRRRARPRADGRLQPDRAALRAARHRGRRLLARRARERRLLACRATSSPTVAPGPSSRWCPNAGGNDPDTVDAAIVVPVRENVWLTPGRPRRPGRAGGRSPSTRAAGCTRSSTSATSAPDVPLTWLVDPAVPAAVARLAAGNPRSQPHPGPRRGAGGAHRGAHRGAGVADRGRARRPRAVRRLARPDPPGRSRPGADRGGAAGRRPGGGLARPLQARSPPVRPCWPCRTATSTCPQQPRTAPSYYDAGGRPQHPGDGVRWGLRPPRRWPRATASSAGPPSRPPLRTARSCWPTRPSPYPPTRRSRWCACSSTRWSSPPAAPRPVDRARRPPTIPLALRQRLLSEAALRLQSGCPLARRDDAARRLAAHRSRAACSPGSTCRGWTRSPWPTSACARPCR